MGVPFEGLEQCPPFVDNHVHGVFDLGGHIRHLRPHWLGVGLFNFRIDKSPELGEQICKYTSPFSAVQ